MISSGARATRSGRAASTALTAATLITASPIPMRECTASIAGSDVPSGTVSEIASSKLVAVAPTITASQDTTPTVPRNAIRVRDYLVAIVDRDGERACDQLSGELRADIEGAPAAREAGRSCADVMQLAAGLNPGLKEQDVEELEIRVVEDGDRARATLQNPFSRREETLRLVRDGEDWRLSSLETRPTG